MAVALTALAILAPLLGMVVALLIWAHEEPR